MSKPNNPPLFKAQYTDDQIYLRDLFAAFAPSPSMFPASERYETATTSAKGPGAEPETARRYRYADWMLEERERQK